MPTLKRDIIEPVMGFNFHLPGGYPRPDLETLKRCWNTAVNGQIRNFTDRQSVRRNYGTEFRMEYDWSKQRWEVKEIFFNLKS